MHVSVDLNIGGRELTIFCWVGGGNWCTLNQLAYQWSNVDLGTRSHIYRLLWIATLNYPVYPVSSTFSRFRPALSVPSCADRWRRSPISIPVDPKQCPTHVLFWQLLIIIQVLSNSDHVTPILFSHFAIVLASCYRRASLPLPQRLEKRTMTSWNMRRFPAEYDLRSTIWIETSTKMYTLF